MTTSSTTTPESSQQRPSVLVVCVHNAGRSQMAQAWVSHLAGDAVEVRSAGSAPGDAVNPAAVEAMAEVGIDMSAAQPKVLTTESVQSSDVVITMGCGDACPIFPGKRYEDWELADPAGLLEGKGKRMRHVKIRPGPALDAPALEALIAAAHGNMVERVRRSRDA